MQSNNTINRIGLTSSALVLMLLAACNGPVRNPIQPQPQAPTYPILVNPLGQFFLDQGRPGVGAQFVPLPGRKSTAGQTAAEALLNQLLSAPKR
jgi:hypothetical protein